jgi:rubredoxin
VAEEEQKNRYECEVCGRVDETTEEEAYSSGWDYPPFIGVWGIVSPRTCPNCTIEKTAYWYLMTRKAEDQGPLPENHMKTILRIMKERDTANATA